MIIFSIFWEARVFGESPLEVIDVHNHLVGQNKQDFKRSIQTALTRMDKIGVKKMLILPPPFPPGHRGLYTYRDFIDAIQAYPDRFGFLAGGGILNGMVQEAVESGNAANALKEKFRKEAEKMIDAGAVGFGELTAEHLCLGPMHNHQQAPPDHPFFLLLADIAAAHDIPIDIHMEAVPEEMPVPPHLARFQANPRILTPNIEAFERLLSHNRKAKIIWDHCGWDNTGKRTVHLDRRLLSRHPNLYMSFKISYNDSTPAYQPIDRDGKLKPEWLKLIKDFPDRFMIGSDQFFISPQVRRPPFPPSFRQAHEILPLLPSDLRRQVGYKNAKHVFHMN